MYSFGDKVLYGVHGVCVVQNIETRTVDKKKRDYFVLQPVGGEKDRFYIPIDNPVVLSKVRPLLTKEQLVDLLHNGSSGEVVWIPDENQRKQRFREMISSGDRAVLIGIIRTLYAHKAAQLEQDRKFHMCDENFLRDALKLLGSEISYVLQISQADATDYIHQCLSK